jgi:hypothetical protein
MRLHQVYLSLFNLCSVGIRWFLHSLLCSPWPTLANKNRASIEARHGGDKEAKPTYTASPFASIRSYNSR